MSVPLAHLACTYLHPWAIYPGHAWTVTDLTGMWLFDWCIPAPLGHLTGTCLDPWPIYPGHAWARGQFNREMPGPVTNPVLLKPCIPEPCNPGALGSVILEPCSPVTLEPCTPVLLYPEPLSCDPGTVEPCNPVPL